MRSIVYATHRSWKIQTNSTNWLTNQKVEQRNRTKERERKNYRSNMGQSFILVHLIRLFSHSIVITYDARTKIECDDYASFIPNLLPHSNDWKFFSLYLWFTFMDRIIVCVIFLLPLMTDSLNSLIYWLAIILSFTNDNRV